MAESGTGRLSPLYDRAFLRIFGSQDSKEMTRGLANALLRASGLPEIGPVDEISADASSPGGVSLKSPRTDVLIVSGPRAGMPTAVVDLEAQRERTNVAERALYYGARHLVDRHPKGGDPGYGDLPRVVVIVLADGFAVFGGAAFLHVCQMAWRGAGQAADGPVVAGGEPGPGNITLVIAELQKVRERYNSIDSDVLADEATAWLCTLAHGYEQDAEVSMASEVFDSIEGFAAHYGIALDDPELKRAYRAYEDSLMEEAFRHKAQEEYYREKFEKEYREKGFNDGYDKGREQLVGKLRNLGVDDAIIQQALA